MCASFLTLSAASQPQAFYNENAAAEGSGPEGSGLGAAAAASRNKNAMALRFARSIALGSTRTISGGDAYDAVDLLFRNRDLIILTPLSGRESCVEMAFERASPENLSRTSRSIVAATLGGFPGAPPGGGNGGGGSFSGGGAGGAGGGEGSVGGAGSGSGTGSSWRRSTRFSTSPQQSHVAPSIARGFDALLWPCVNVTSRTFYRLRDADGEDDVGVAEAVFRRKFLCDGYTSGQICVILHASVEVRLLSVLRGSGKVAERIDAGAGCRYRWCWWKEAVGYVCLRWCCPSLCCLWRPLIVADAPSQAHVAAAQRSALQHSRLDNNTITRTWTKLLLPELQQLRQGTLQVQPLQAPGEAALCCEGGCSPCTHAINICATTRDSTLRLKDKHAYEPNKHNRRAGALLSTTWRPPPTSNKTCKQIACSRSVGGRVCTMDTC